MTTITNIKIHVLGDFTVASQFYVYVNVELYVHAFIHLYGGENRYVFFTFDGKLILYDYESSIFFGIKYWGQFVVKNFLTKYTYLCTPIDM